MLVTVRQRSTSLVPVRTWRQLLKTAGTGELLVLLVAWLALRDNEVLVVVGALAFGLVLLGRRGAVPGAIGVGAVSFVVAGFMLHASVSNMLHREQVLAVLIPGVLAVLSCTAVIAAGAEVASRGRDWRNVPMVAVTRRAALVVLALAIAAGFAVQIGAPARRAYPGELALQIRNSAYSVATLRTHPGHISVAITNRDLFWHTLTIPALGLDLVVPTGGERRVSFSAAAGRYSYVCRIPGHAALGMRGTLIVH